jgi:hypothetical protein
MESLLHFTEHVLVPSPEVTLKHEIDCPSDMSNATAWDGTIKACNK